MVLDLLKMAIRMPKSSFFLVTLFFFSFYEMYFILHSHLLGLVIPSGFDSGVMIQTILYFFTIFSLIIGVFLVRKFSKLNIVYFCSLLNCFLSVFLLLDLFNWFRLFVLFVLVFFVSLGMLTTLGIFGNLTIPEERGRIGGLIGFVVFVIYLLVTSYFLNLDFLSSVLLGLLINALPLIGLLTKIFRVKVISIRDQQVQYYEKRVFILYFIPWIMFSLLNSVLAKNTTSIIEQQFSPSIYSSLLSVQVLGIVFGVLIGGFIADLFGRRFSLVFSLTLYGFGAALVGLFATYLVFLVVYAASGLSWGFLFALYIFVVWGDLSDHTNRLKVYSIGLITYFLSLGIGSFIEVSMPIFQSALLSVMIIFVLNMPIIFAPELLPSYVLDKIKMKMHMRAVKKLQKKN